MGERMRRRRKIGVEGREKDGRHCRENKKSMEMREGRK